MKCITTPLLTILLTTTTLAAPPDFLGAKHVQNPNKVCDKAGLYICEHINWQGNCTRHAPCLGSSDETCYQLDGKASSIGPDKGFVCSFYQNGVCRDLQGQGILRVKYPGYGNLFETEMGNWNDKVYSVQCFRS